MRTKLTVCENHFFPFNIDIWTEFPFIPRDGDVITDYVDIEYYMLDEQEKSEISRDDFKKYSSYLSNLVVHGNAWWCKDHMGPYCSLFVECE